MTKPNATDPHEPLVSPPRFLARWYVWTFAAAFLLVPFFVTIPLKLRKHPVIGPLGDQVHIPFLGAIMLLIYWKGPLRGRLWRSAIAAAVCGALIEFIQLLVGRAALFGDWVLDLVGIGIILGFVLWRGLGRRWGLVLMSVLLLTIPWNMRSVPAVIRAQEIAAARFPLLDDFENPASDILWDDTDGGQMRFVRAGDGRGEDLAGPASRLSITGSPPSTWPGARMIHFPFDWSDYSRLLVRIRCAEDNSEGVPFTLRVDDFAGRKEDARFTTRFRATSKWQTFVMPLVGREASNCEHVIDMSDMETVYIYLDAPKTAVRLLVDRVWVE